MIWKLSCAALVLVGGASAKASDWWWFGLNGQAPSRQVTYIDAQSIVPLKGETIQALTLAVGETALPNGQQHQVTRYAIRCKKRRFAVMGYFAYDAAGNQMPARGVEPGQFDPVVPGSIGEAVANIACGKPAGTEVRVADPLQHSVNYFAGSVPSSAATAAGTAETRLSVGTGFFLTADGKALTSYHVVEGADDLACRSADGTYWPARVIRSSPSNDLALLQVDTRPSTHLNLSQLGSAKPGDRVFTLGYGAPNYLGANEPRYTDGAISALTGLGEDAYMQITVPVQPGNSGGPLLNEAGQVVGIIAAQAATEAFVKAEGTLPQSINWAVKSDYAAPLIGVTIVTEKRSREAAIDAARRSLCLIVARQR